MSIMGTGLPQKVMVKHRYVQSITFQSTAGSFNTFAWYANGMFSPAVGGPTAAGAHQPMYFDQYSALYDHYCVIGAKVTFKVACLEANDNESAFRMCAFVDDNNTLTATNIDAVCEATTGRTMTLIPADSTDQKVKTLKFSAKRTFGKSVLGNASLSGTPLANPTELSYFILALQASPALSYSALITAEIEYIAIWTELKEVAQS